MFACAEREGKRKIGTPTACFHSYEISNRSGGGSPVDKERRSMIVYQ